MELQISGHTQLYCLLGSPVGHSGSPAMYNYNFARTGVDAVHLAFDIPQNKLEEGEQDAKMPAFFWTSGIGFGQGFRIQKIY